MKKLLALIGMLASAFALQAMEPKVTTRPTPPAFSVYNDLLATTEQFIRNELETAQAIEQTDLKIAEQHDVQKLLITRLNQQKTKTNAHFQNLEDLQKKANALLEQLKQKTKS